MSTIKGKVKNYNSQKGYGFIETENGDNVFVHFTNIKVGHMRKQLINGEEVSFEMIDGKKGPEAGNVVVANPDKHWVDKHQDVED